MAQRTTELGRTAISHASEPDVFLRNAFRLLQMPTHAQEREIQRRTRSIGGSLAVGMRPEPGLCPLLPLSVTQSDVRAAREALSSASQRIVHELFWFWTSDVDPELKHSLALLAEGDEVGAEAQWRRLASEEVPQTSAIARHNLAVLALTLAVEESMSAIARGLLSQPGRSDGPWSQIPLLWDAVLEDPTVWCILGERVEALGDPAVRASDLESLREAVPAALATLSTTLALRAAARGLVDDAVQLTQIARYWDRAIPSAGQASPLALATEDVRRGLRDHCALSLRAATDAPLEAARTARTLVDQVRPDLNALSLLLDRKDPLWVERLDELANLLLHCALTYEDATADVEEARALASMAVRCAASPSVQEYASSVGSSLASTPRLPIFEDELPDTSLEDAFCPDMHALNPYNIAELRVDAGAAQIARRREEVDRAQCEGVPLPPGPYPSGIPAARDPVAVSEALDALEEGRGYRVWAMLSLWPQAWDTRLTDAALEQANTSIADSVALWQRQADVYFDPCVPLHNLAVALHRVAIEGEATTDGGQNKAAWLSAYGAWARLLEDRSFRNWLALKWAGASSVATLRAIRRGLLGINASLATSAALRGDHVTAGHHLDVVGASRFPRDDQAAAISSQVPRLVSALQEWVTWGKQIVQDNPRQGREGAHHLLDRGGVLLQVLTTMLGAKDERLQSYHDQVALSAATCTIAYGQVSKEWEDCIPILERCRAVAGSDEAVQAIRILIGQAERGGQPVARRLSAGRQPAARLPRPSSRARPQASPGSQQRKNSAGVLWVIASALAITLLAILPSVEPTALPTPTATRRVSTRSTPRPILGRTPRPIVLPSPRSTCEVRYIWVPERGDVSIPDGTVLSPGQPFTKTWSVGNGSECPWEGVVLRHADGDRLGARIQTLVERREPNEFVEISIPMVAPATPGEYVSRWQLCPAQGECNDKPLSVHIVVR